jgi:O-antigen ligase
VLIGFPIGSGYLRLDSAASGYIDAQPHNEIVNQYLRVGVFGTILLILFTVRPIYIYFREPDSGSLLYPTPASWVLVTIGVIVFGFPYSYSLEIFALVAMANGLIDAADEGALNRSRSLQP